MTNRLNVGTVTTFDFPLSGIHENVIYNSLFGKT
jgi:hypothetical protein